MQTQIEQVVRQFVVDNFLFGQNGESLSDTASLLDAGLIDSTGVLELVGLIEKNFAIQVADTDVMPENLDSIARISAFVHRKLEAKRAAEKEHAHAR